MQIIRPFDLTFADYTTTVLENDAPLYSSGTTYNIGDQVVQDHRVFVSAIDSNTGNDPLLENQELTGVRWLLIGFTNAFSFIDGTIGNPTTDTSTITITIDNVDGLDALLIVGVQASTIQVQGFDSGSVEVYNETTSLSGREVYTYYQWFTEPIGPASTKLFVNDFPSDVASLTLTVSGTDIEIGELIAGDILNVGTATMSPQTAGEVKYYGRVEFNSYGKLVKIEGPTRNIMQYRVHIPGPSFPVIKDQMDRMAGNLVGAVGSPNRPSTIQLGFLGTIKWSEGLPGDYIITFKVEGST